MRAEPAAKPIFTSIISAVCSLWLPVETGWSDEQAKKIPVSFRGRILSGALDYTLGCLIERELDVSIFDQDFVATALFKR